MPERGRYNYYVTNGDVISLFRDGNAMPFETIGIDALLRRAGFDGECE